MDGTKSILTKSILTKNQKQSWTKIYTEDGISYRIIATARYDDECGNGHNTFAITGQIKEKTESGRWVEHSGGCIHKEIAEHFPSLKPYIKWHLCASDGPIYYIANTVYHAGDRDCWGLKKGEKQQIKNGKTGQLCWILESESHLPKYVDSDTCPSGVITLKYVPWYREGEGKERDLDAARSTAVWPDATDEDLTAPGLEERLKARLPALMAEFKRDIEALGFVY